MWLSGGSRILKKPHWATTIWPPLGQQIRHWRAAPGLLTPSHKTVWSLQRLMAQWWLADARPVVKGLERTALSGLPELSKFAQERLKDARPPWPVTSGVLRDYITLHYIGYTHVASSVRWGVTSGFLHVNAYSCVRPVPILGNCDLKWVEERFLPHNRLHQPVG